MKKYNFVAPITANDVWSFNTEAKKEKIILVFKNTKNLNPDLVRQLSDNVTISVTGGLDPAKHKFNNNHYQSRTLYSPKELSYIISVFEKIERKINPMWTDLEKAMFVYKSLCEYLTYGESNINNKDASRSLLGLINGKSVCAGCALIFKEAMDRIGIPCIYQNKQGAHCWNIIKVDGKYYEAELTWDVGKKRENECGFLFFGQNDKKKFYSHFAHDISRETEEQEYDLEKIPDAVLKQTLDKINKSQTVQRTYPLTADTKSVVINGYTIYVRNNMLVCPENKLMTFVRNDNSSFLILPLNKQLNGVYSYAYIEYDKYKNEIVVHRIYSEMKNICSDDFELRENIANNLLSKERLQKKVKKFNGYIGYVTKGSSLRYCSADFENKVLNVFRAM